MDEINEPEQQRRDDRDRAQDAWVRGEGGQLEMDFGAFTRDPEADDREMEDGFAAHALDDEPSLVPGVTLGELRRRSEDRTAIDRCAYCGSEDVMVPKSRIAHCNACGKNFVLADLPDNGRSAFSVLSAFFSLPLARKERQLPRLVTRARAADLFERFFGPRAYLGGRIYS